MGGEIEQPRLPHEGQELTYNSYLKVSEITGLQKPLSEPEAHDEMLFIIVHQTYELWFKQILHDLTRLIVTIRNDELVPSYRLLNRINTIFKTLIQQVDVLETMTPVEFNAFRTHLNPASGFQSAQFRELELMLGADPKDYSKFAKLNPEWKVRIETRVHTPNLRAAFFELLKKRELIAEPTPEALQYAIHQIYYNSDFLSIHNLCEKLLELDEQFTLWRFRHVQMVERMIGMKRGTGGSLGVDYLKTTLERRFFSELWEARTSMNG